MSNPAWTTPDILASEPYCRIDANALETYRDSLQSIIEAVTDQMIDYIGSPVDDNGWTDAPPPRLQRACAKQCAYEFNRRKDIGLSGINFKEGSVQKLQTHDFLDEVKRILDRCTDKSF